MYFHKVKNCILISSLCCKYVENGILSTACYRRAASCAVLPTAIILSTLAEVPNGSVVKASISGTSNVLCMT